MNRDLNNYLKYLIETLGVKNIFDFNAPDAEEKQLSLDKKYLFFIEDLSTYNRDELDLLNKMISAMKINPDDYAIFDFKAIESNQTQFKISFKNNPVDKNDIYSPRVLLQNPQFKKKAWDDIKRILHLS